MPLYFIVTVPVIDDSYLVGNSYKNTPLAASDGGVGSSLRTKVAPEGKVFRISEVAVGVTSVKR